MRNLNSYFRTLIRKKMGHFGNYSIVVPGKVSQQNTVPSHIPKPSYYKTGFPAPCMKNPEIKNADQISKLRTSCKMAANILKQSKDMIKVGQTTNDIDDYVHNLIIENGAYPSPLNYKGYPKSICTSVNNVVCHGIPDDRPLQDGDIVNIDLTVFFNGYHGDCSKTFLIGNVDESGCKLVEATESCLQEGINTCKAGEKFRTIGYTIHKKAKTLNFSVVPVFIGHGIGTYFHGPPDIIHCRNNYPGVMEAGMTFTIEPVLSQGSTQILILQDNWTAITTDNSRTAQFEHTILITATGFEILTLPD
ncbi:hypothetical protein FQA39_LY17829 [Lamprigera yunnana]|nr:hypothetical protein FQA39_LY17829 [Lamprigera yunnana]